MSQSFVGLLILNNSGKSSIKSIDLCVVNGFETLVGIGRFILGFFIRLFTSSHIKSLV